MLQYYLSLKTHYNLIVHKSDNLLLPEHISILYREDTQCIHFIPILGMKRGSKEQ